MKLLLLLLLAVLAVASASALELQPVTPGPQAPLSVSNPSPATPIAAQGPNGKVSALLEMEVDPSKVEAPVPPPGAVKSASEIKPAVKPAVAASKPLFPAASEASKFLAGLQKPVKKTQPTLSSEWLEKINARLDAIRDAQDAAPKAKDDKAARQNAAAKLIARQIQKILEKSAATLKKAEQGKLSQDELDKLTLGSKAAKTAEGPAGLNKIKDPAKKAASTLKGANALLPPGFKAPKPVSAAPKASFTYGVHADNPKHKLKARKLKNKAKVVGAPRFQQLPVGVVGDGHNERLMQTVQAVLDLDNPSKDYKGHVNDEGKLCPTCNEIKYNADSPLSENDKKLLAATHADLSLKGVKLHSQDTLDRATLMVDDANDLRKALLDKYPPANSLIQFDSRN